MSEPFTQYSHLIHLRTKPQEATAVMWDQTPQCYNYLEKVFLKDITIQWWEDKVAISFGTAKAFTFAAPHEYIVKTGDSVEVFTKEELDTKFDRI